MCLRSYMYNVNLSLKRNYYSHDIVRTIVTTVYFSIWGFVSAFARFSLQITRENSYERPFLKKIDDDGYSYMYMYIVDESMWIISSLLKERSLVESIAVISFRSYTVCLI